MARKGAGQQLQLKIDTNDELDDFLQQKGLLLLEIYSKWFGPCTAIYGVLRKIKMDIGGDNLHLGAVQCDNIERVQRFCNTSEPVWMFVTNGKMVSCVLGTNVPELTNEMRKQLANIEQQQPIKTYELNELSPIEQKRCEMIKQNDKQNELQLLLDSHRKYVENLKLISNKIKHHMADMGVTIILPHVYHSQLYQELSEVGNGLKMAAKYRETCRILPEHLDIINFDCSKIDENIPMDLWNYIVNKEIFMICWKISDDELRPVEEMCHQLVQIVTDVENNWQPNEDTDEQIFVHLKPLVMQIKKPKELLSSDESPIDDELRIAESAPVHEELRMAGVASDTVDDEFEAMKKEVKRIIANIFGKPERHSNSAEVEVKNDKEGAILMDDEIDRIISKVFLMHKATAKNNIETENLIKNEIMNIVLNMNDVEINIADLECSQYVTKSNLDVPSSIPTTISKLNGIWTPFNKTTNALFIYLYFRAVTEHFLPPDRGPEKPHLLMIFGLNKRRTVLNVIEKYQSDVLAFGYFATDINAVNAPKLIAKTNLSYENVGLSKPLGTKVVLKIANETNDALFALANCEPAYISQNTTSGKIDCEKYFPSNYPFGVEMADIQFGCASLLSNASNSSSRSKRSTNTRMSNII